MVWDLDYGILYKNAVIAFNRHTISRSNLYSFCEEMCSCKAMPSD